MKVLKDTWTQALLCTDCGSELRIDSVDVFITSGGQISTACVLCNNVVELDLRRVGPYIEEKAAMPVPRATIEKTQQVIKGLKPLR